MRAELVALLIARGFAPDDATPFVARLSDQQVSEDLRWHRWEASHHAAGPPSSWSPAVRSQVSDHYLGPAHNVAGYDVMAMLAHGAPERGMAPAPQPGTGVAIVGVLLILGGAAVAYALARR